MGLSGLRGPDCCVFGDILGLVPDGMLQQMREEISLQGVVTKNDLLRALPRKHSVRHLLKKNGRLKVSLGDIPRDATLLGGPSGSDIADALAKLEAAE